MAVGVPATGMGGIFYILLSILIVVYKVIKKVLHFFGKKITKSQEKLGLWRFPTLAFIICVGLLSYMNLTGFRFVIPGTQQTALSISNLWLLGLFAVGMFVFCIAAFHIRSKQMKEKQIQEIH